MGVLYQLSYASNFKTSPEAGDGTRTRDHKLGRLVLYQLSYSRKYTTKNPPHRATMVGEGFEPSKA